jgi:hypothetical protein
VNCEERCCLCLQTAKCSWILRGIIFWWCGYTVTDRRGLRSEYTVRVDDSVRIYDESGLRGDYICKHDVMILWFKHDVEILWWKRLVTCFLFSLLHQFSQIILYLGVAEKSYWNEWIFIWQFVTPLKPQTGVIGRGCHGCSRRCQTITWCGVAYLMVYLYQYMVHRSMCSSILPDVK